MTGKQKRAKDQPWMNKCRVCGKQATNRQLVDAGAGNGWLFYCDQHQPPSLMDLLPAEEDNQ